MQSKAIYGRSERQILIRSRLVDYVILTKPGIVALVILATMTGIYFARRGMPEIGLTLWTLMGIGLITAGSAVLNNYLDRDIDRLMERTASRAVAAGTIVPSNALTFGLLLIAVSILIFISFVNILTAILAAAAAFGYVVLYGMILKRRSPYANQVGGLAGALPPVIGHAAITGELGGEAWILFIIMALWQHPHALSLALKYRDEYAGASIPVIPVAKGITASKKRIAAYTLFLLPATTLPYFYGMAGSYYLYTSLTIGAVYFYLALRFYLSSRSSDMFLFFFSIIHLLILFTALVADVV